MNANEIARAARAQDYERLYAYLVHFAEHLSSHCVDVARRRAEVEETLELTELLDTAMADLETSYRSMMVVVTYLSKSMDNHSEHGRDHRHF